MQAAFEYFATWGRRLHPPLLFWGFPPIPWPNSRRRHPITVGFFGHSLGALVAYKVARRLAERDLPAPVFLVASASESPAAQAKHRAAIAAGTTDGLASLTDEAFVRKVSTFPKKNKKTFLLFDIFCWVCWDECISRVFLSSMPPHTCTALRCQRPCLAPGVSDADWVCNPMSCPIPDS